MTLKINPFFPLVVLAVSIFFSYLTHVGWWTFAGISFFIAGVFVDNEDKKHKLSWLVYIFSVLVLVFLILAILAMKWVYSIS
jgi:hypothetical protein